MTPRTAADLAATLADAAGAGQKVTPAGGGRAAGFGELPEREDVVLSTAALDQIVEVSQSDLTVTVQGGVTLEKLQEALGRVGQFLPLDPRNSPGHTVGGALACGWTGPLRMRFGSPREFVIGLQVATPDGRLVRSGGRVVKNVSGYDLNKVHLGALGTLGVIVEASFKVFPKPAGEVTVERRCAGGGEAWQEAARLLRLPQAPWALEVERDAQGEHRVMALLAGPAAAVERLQREVGWDESREAWSERARITSAAWARIAVPRDRLAEVMTAIPGGGHWIAQPGTGLADWLDAADAEAVRAVRRHAEASGGSLVLLAAPDDVRAQAGVWGTPPPTLDLMRRLREVFDPQRTINPGRYLV